MPKVKSVFPVWWLFFLSMLLGIHLFGADFFKAREEALNPGPWHLGPFQLFPQVTLENAGYTDNIYRYSLDPQPGWTADLGLRLKINTVVGRRLVLVLEGHPYYSYFSAVDTERAFNHTLSGWLYAWLAGVHLMYRYDYGNMRGRPNNEFAARVRTYSRVHQVEADMGNHSALFVTLFAKHQTMDYAEDGFMERFQPGMLLDRKEQTTGIKIHLPVFTATLLTFEVDFSQNRFSQTPQRDGNALMSLMQVQFPEVGKLTGSAAFGYKRYIPDSPEYGKFDTLYGSGRIQYRFLRNWRLELQYSVDNLFSFINPDYYFNQRSLQTGLDYYLSRNLRLGGSILTGRNDYYDLAGGALQFRDNYLQYRVSLAFRLAQTTGIGISFSRQEWDSERSDLQRSYFSIGGFITHEF